MADPAWGHRHRGGFVAATVALFFQVVFYPMGQAGTYLGPFRMFVLPDKYPIPFSRARFSDSILTFDGKHTKRPNHQDYLYDLVVGPVAAFWASYSHCCHCRGGARRRAGGMSECP